MKNFSQIYGDLQEDMNTESVIIYKTLAKKFGSETLCMGDDPITKKPRILYNREVVRVKCNTRIDGYYTKINHIGIEKGFGGERVFIKGWVVNRGRYRLKSFTDLKPMEKINILEHMNNLI